jgi:hypothetical protein
MIGVLAREGELEAVREFFELFKTPWEEWQPGRIYDVVLCASEECIEHLRANLILIYSGSQLQSDPRENVCEESLGEAIFLSYKEDEIPIFGRCLTFAHEKSKTLSERRSGRSAALFLDSMEEARVVRIGYDLFAEIGFLLTTGQPVEQAGVPTVELHIEFLRDRMREANIPFIEIPPVPEGYRFIACLTHDVDHPEIRNHRWDHTAAGFLYRASIGSLARFARGSIALGTLITNWLAAARWPFVQLGLARDFWADFHEQYRRIEGELPSTYFVIPLSGRSGLGLDNNAYKRRASAYSVEDIEPTIRKILDNGCEIGLHGIDAWVDSEAASVEIDKIRLLTGESKIGVRMHWLCFDETSPHKLDSAGIMYDSTVGYRETVGYRAGTTQVYKAIGVKSLLELPLHIMDTALFYPSYLGLNLEGARKTIAPLLKNAVRFAGCLTINWHDRSLAPERLWEDTYRETVEELRREGAWFATAGQATAWFQKRREVTFLNQNYSESDITQLTGSHRADLPALRIIKYGARSSHGSGSRLSTTHAERTSEEGIAIASSI